MSLRPPLHSRDDEMLSEINMIPMIDIMLVLLIIFMITAPIVTHSLSVDLPQAKNQAHTPQSASFYIGIDAKQNLYLNEQAIKPQELASLLKQTALKKPDTPVWIQADRKVSYEKVIEVMALVQQSGISSLGFITQGD